MKSRDFCYWLQGYFEVKEGETTTPNDKSLTHQQVVMIKNHLAMVFKHEIDPSFGREQSILDIIHKPPVVPATSVFDGGPGPVTARC